MDELVHARRARTTATMHPGHFRKCLGGRLPCRAFEVKVVPKRLPVFPFSGLLKDCKGHKTHRFENGGTNQIRKTGKRDVVLGQPLPQTPYEASYHGRSYTQGNIFSLPPRHLRKCLGSIVAGRKGACPADLWGTIRNSDLRVSSYPWGTGTVPRRVPTVINHHHHQGDMLHPLVNHTMINIGLREQRFTSA